MKKILYIVLLIVSSAYSQGFDALLIASQAQFANEAPTNFYTLANAANPNSEVNAATGISGGNTNWTATSVTTNPTPQNGAYALKVSKITASSEVTTYINLTGLTASVTYKIEIYGMKVNSGNWQVQCRSWEGWDSDVSINYQSATTNVWTYGTMTAISNTSNPTILIYATTAGNGETAFAIDNIIITEL
jgi:hypothetical protein